MAGDLTRDQMVTEVCDIVGKSVNASSVSGATLKTRVETLYINWAQQRIARFANFIELDVIQDSAVTVANIGIYPLETGTNNLGLVRPKDIASIVLKDSENSRRLTLLPRKIKEQRFPYPEGHTYGRPSVYTPIGNSIELFRIPDAAYTLRIVYPQWPTPFTTASQKTDFDDKDQLLITTTIMETYLALEEYQDAAVWFNKLKGMLPDATATGEGMDWTPSAEPFGSVIGISSGTPWLEPGALPDDPLYGYPS